MTRGGLGADFGDTVMVRTTRRARSVFDDGGRHYSPSPSSRAKRYELEDLDDMRSASRKQDRALMDSISTRLVDNYIYRPVDFVGRRYSLPNVTVYNEPPAMRVRRIVIVPTMTPSRGYRSTSLPPVAPRVRRYEEPYDYEVLPNLMKISPRRSRHLYNDLVWPEYYPSKVPRYSLKEMHHDYGLPSNYKRTTPLFYDDYLDRGRRKMYHDYDLPSNYKRTTPLFYDDYLDRGRRERIEPKKNYYIYNDLLWPDYHISMANVPTWYYKNYQDIIRQPEYYPYLKSYGQRNTPSFSSQPYGYSDTRSYVRDTPVYSSPSRLMRAGSEPPPRTSSSRSFTPSTNLAVRDARRRLQRIEHELSVGTDYDFPGDGLPPRYPVRPLVKTKLQTSSRRPVLGTAKKGYTYPERSSRVHDIETRISLLAEPTQALSHESYNSLRARTAEARAKMDQTRVLLDRYLPLPMGPSPEVEHEVAIKYGELAERMPILEQGRIRGEYNGPIQVQPYKPATRKRGQGLYGVDDGNATFRPPMSETRKRARDVLCKTKGNPYYY